MRWLTPWELGLGLLLAALVGAYGAPIARVALHRSLRAEVPYIIDSLVAAQIAHQAEQGDWFDLPMTPAAPDRLGTQRTPWPKLDLPWQPPTGTARGTYYSERVASGIALHGLCDVDGDGERAHYVQTPGGPMTRLTPADVY